MITDNETNFLYLSDILPSKKKFYASLIDILSRANINYKLLHGTKDIWCVDFMPVQVALNNFIQFTFRPDYLQNNKWIDTQTNPDDVCEAHNLHPTKSKIKLDGGNVIKGKNWVILTDKILNENKSFKRKDLTKELEKLFSTKVIIIPKEPEEMTGHADGILRYYDSNTVLINNYRKSYLPEFQNELSRTLKKEGLKTIQIPFNTYKNKSKISATGLYINYLQMKDFLLIPKFDLKEDELTYRLFEQLFPGQVIKTIDSKEISKDGGVLNCIAWNIKMDQNTSQ